MYAAYHIKILIYLFLSMASFSTSCLVLQIKENRLGNSKVCGTPVLLMRSSLGHNDSTLAELQDTRRIREGLTSKAGF